MERRVRRSKEKKSGEAGEVGLRSRSRFRRKGSDNRQGGRRALSKRLLEGLLICSNQQT